MTANMGEPSEGARGNSPTTIHGKSAIISNTPNRSLPCPNLATHHAIYDPPLLNYHRPFAQGKEAFCIRWKGFHGNIISCLEGIKTDSEFVDVTLACDQGFSVQAHKLILASSSPYFRRILRETSGNFPVIILNDVMPDILDALMTYMYQGQVFLTEDRLPVFFKTASCLEIKGIADNPGNLSSSFAPPTNSMESLDSSLHHPAGDLTLLAAAATSSLSNNHHAKINESVGAVSITKRRKTLPKRLDLRCKVPKVNHHLVEHNQSSTMTSNYKHHEMVNNKSDSYDDNLAILNLSMKSKSNLEPTTCVTSSPSLAAKAGLLTIPNPVFTSSILRDSSTDSGIKYPSTSPVTALDMSMNDPTSASEDKFSPHPIKMELSSSPRSDDHEQQGQRDLPTSASSSSSVGSNTKEEDKLSPDLLPGPVSNSTTPEQMAALLGPSWKSRQPRLCQYCQRMFSNKFNLKQHILNMHTVGRELQCDICQKKVKNKWYLRRHHVTHHGAPLKK